MPEDVYWSSDTLAKSQYPTGAVVREALCGRVCIPQRGEKVSRPEDVYWSSDTPTLFAQIIHPGHAYELKLNCRDLLYKTVKCPVCRPPQHPRILNTLTSKCWGYAAYKLQLKNDPRHHGRRKGFPIGVAESCSSKFQCSICQVEDEKLEGDHKGVSILV